LVLWCKYDLSFALARAHAYQGHVPGAEAHIQNAGHFALDEAAVQITQLTLDFLTARLLDSNGTSATAG